MHWNGIQKTYLLSYCTSKSEQAENSLVLPTYCVNSKVRLFADDCLLYREIKNNQDQIDMQSDLDALMD